MNIENFQIIIVIPSKLILVFALLAAKFTTYTSLNIRMIVIRAIPANRFTIILNYYLY